MRVCILPPAIFLNVFDVGLYNFTIISSLFDSDKVYTLCKHNRKCANEMHHASMIVSGEALKISVKKFKQNLRENYSKNTKIAITACKFSKFFRGSMPMDSPRAFLASQSASN